MKKLWGGQMKNENISIICQIFSSRGRFGLDISLENEEEKRNMYKKNRKVQGPPE